MEPRVSELPEDLSEAETEFDEPSPRKHPRCTAIDASYDSSWKENFKSAARIKNRLFPYGPRPREYVTHANETKTGHTSSLNQRAHKRKHDDSDSTTLPPAKVQRKGLDFDKSRFWDDTQGSPQLKFVPKKQATPKFIPNSLLDKGRSLEKSLGVSRDEMLKSKDLGTGPCTTVSDTRGSKRRADSSPSSHHPSKKICRTNRPAQLTGQDEPRTPIQKGTYSRKFARDTRPLGDGSSSIYISARMENEMPRKADPQSIQKIHKFRTRAEGLISDQADRARMKEIRTARLIGKTSSLTSSDSEQRLQINQTNSIDLRDAKVKRLSLQLDSLTSGLTDKSVSSVRYLLMFLLAYETKPNLLI